MKPIEKIGEDLFQKLRSRFSPVSMGDENAEETSDPRLARIFNFMYKDEEDNVGYVSISIINNRSFKIYYGTDLIDRIKNKSNWYRLLKDLRMFARRNLMTFDARDLSKNQLEPRDFKFISTQDGAYKGQDVAVSESVMFGSRRKSYQTMENVKMIVNHRKSIDETIPGSRSRYIESIYLERADGERYKFPYNYLTGARAMARHVVEGGNPYDDTGKHIIGMIKEMRDLSKFARRTKKYAMEDENASNIRNSVVERFQNIKKQLSAMSIKEGYDKFVANTSNQEIFNEDDNIQQIKEKFTRQIFDTQLEDTLPAVMRAIKETEMNQILEADKSIETLIRNKPLVLRKDPASDSMFRSTKFTDGAGLLGFILSDIASRAIGDDADVVANFASDAAERVQDREYPQKDKQLAMMLAKKYMDDVKKMTSNPEYADQVRIDPKDVYGKMKKREGGFHEAEEFENWANELVPENSVKKKYEPKVEATTQGTVGTQAPTNMGQALRDPNLQKAARNVSRMSQAAGIKAPPAEVAKGLAAQASGRPMDRKGAQTMMGLGGMIQNAAASDPKKANKIAAMMKQMVTQGRFDETIVENEDFWNELALTSSINENDQEGWYIEASSVFNRHALSEAPNPNFTGAAAMKNPTQRPYDVNNQGKGQVKANPNFKAPVSNIKTTGMPKPNFTGAAAMTNPTQRPYDVNNQGKGQVKANPNFKAPVSNIKTTAPSVPSNYTVNKGDNLSTLAKNWNVSVADIMKANQGIKDPNKIGIGQKLVKPGATGNPIYQHGIGTKSGSQSTQNMFKSK